MGLPENTGLNLHTRFAKGKRNLISDVPGVTVGHKTLKDDNQHIHTGVTVIKPHDGDLFHEKVFAGVKVINGYGKSAGLVQVEELGTIESPIVLTNTLSVGTCLDACVRYMLEKNPDICDGTSSVNCVVTECNDADINDIRGLHVTKEDFDEAIANCSPDFEEGAVGGGTGMICFGMKGGIGSSSRVLNVDGKEYTIGALVMSNFGVASYLNVGGTYFPSNVPKDIREKGSIIMVIATDIPLSDRQLRRMAQRATYALGRLGSYGGNGSGDIAIAFSTGNKLPHYAKSQIIETKQMHDDCLDGVFNATVEAVEEAIVSSLYHGETTHGRRPEDLVVFSFKDVYEKEKQ